LTLSGASRFKSLNLGLSLAASPIDLIKKQSELMHQKYIDSKVYSFHDVYMLGDKIGEGNHASVYKCFRRVNPLPKNEKKTLLTFDPYLPEPFAVKVVREDDNEKILAHEHEFKVLASLKHENIVKVFECFKD